MEPSPPPPPVSPLSDDGQRPMEFHIPMTNAPAEDDPTSSSLWDWANLLDFTVDDHFPINLDDDSPISPPQLNSVENSVEDRVRKRDPRLTCSNFLAGRVPCACPELDELLEEEGLPGKKRVRVARAGVGAIRCQVPGCEADISELKGYHRRHRVCLGCANATSVSLDGEIKRYCQQCGKFHPLTDFDEGKRSCRRKLERHNNRRRRKTHDSRGAGDKGVLEDLANQSTMCDGEAGKDVQVVEREILVESENGRFPSPSSDPNSQNRISDSGLSCGASGDTQMDAVKDDSRFALSPSNCDNKTAYSSLCPTGRISFKLYDWNPAEFPRRLRHQIFEWLANMPVELEGYIRPGCTILTSFISMPTFMWEKLLEDPMSHLHDLVVVPGKMLAKRGPMVIYLNNMIFGTRKDGVLIKVNMKEQAPKLHYVHPTCFEAGKPMEFVACGSNLLQPKFRFLISFAGRYLAYDYCVALPCRRVEGGPLDHQLYKILITNSDSNLVGPAFIEVENESGLSNFIPILIGDRDTCSEMKIIEQRINASRLSNGSLCQISSLRQVAFSELLVDIGWLLKEPFYESIQPVMTALQIQKFTILLKFLLHHESTIILGKLLQNLRVLIDKVEVNKVANGNTDSDMKLLRKCLDQASHTFPEKFEKSKSICLEMETAMLDRNYDSGSYSESGRPSVAPGINEDSGVTANSGPTTSVEEVPLLDKQVVMNVDPVKEWPLKSCSPVSSNRFFKARSSIVLFAIVVVCFGVCAVLLHPRKVGKLAVSIRRCLTERLR